MAEYLTLTPPKQGLAGTFKLPASKSECNRALILQALHPGKIKVENVSSSRDSQTMRRLLESPQSEYDAGDAGTVMRFMTAFLAVQEGNFVLKGTDA